MATKKEVKDTAQISERKLPADVNAEAAVLSAMLIDADVVSKGIEKIREEYFSRPGHKIIFRNICELFNDSIEIDALTLINRLERNNQLEKIGGIPYINEIVDFVVSSANFDYHLNIVTEQALLRHLILACNGIIESCYSSTQPVKSVVDEAEQAIFAIAELPQHQGFLKIDQISAEVLHNIDTIASTKIPVTGIGTGYGDLDKLTGGFRPGQFIIIAARPAMGKTSLALNIASHAAVNLKKKVAIFTMEMAADEVIMRMFSSASEVNMDSMLKGFGMNEEKLIRIMQASEVLSTKHIYIDESGTNTPLEIRAKVRRLAAEVGGLDLIVIDYLQLMGLSKERDNRQQEISEISRALKILAKDMKIPVVALSQLNRMLENREDKRPRLADLRESGAIEQDADLVMFIYRDEYYYPDKTEKPGIAEIIIGKNRHGSTGHVDLGFDKEYTLFRALDTRDELQMISNVLAGIGEYTLFVGRSFSAITAIFKRRLEFLIQFRRIGFDSLLLITLTAAFTGLVTALQAVYQSKGYIPQNLLSVLISKSTMVELAPVLTALVLTGKVGAAMAAEIGTMKVSDQIDALHSMNISPHEFLYMPRILAGLIAFPLITIYANAVGILCAWYFSYLRYSLHAYTFFNSMRSYFEPFDLWSGLIKSIFFGFFITSLACFHGDRTHGGAEGVGRSTTKTVVQSSVAILIMDFIVAWVLFGNL